MKEALATQNPSLKESCRGLSAESLTEHSRVLLNGSLVFLGDRGRSYLDRIKAIVNLVVLVAVDIYLSVRAKLISKVVSRRTPGVQEGVGISLHTALADESVIYHVVKVPKGLNALPLYIISNACFRLHHFLSRAWLNHNVEWRKMKLLDAWCSDIFETRQILHLATGPKMAANEYPQRYFTTLTTNHSEK